MAKKWTPATEVVRTRTPAKSNAELIAEWLKTNKVTKLEMDALTPKEEQGGYGFGRGRKPKTKVTRPLPHP
jgi:hypothetical protein